MYQKGNYTQATNQSNHIEMSQYLATNYGSTINSCKTLCELGVGSGRNLFYLHESYPALKYSGNDINPNIHNEIRSIYPDVLEWASIEIVDTLTYLKKLQSPVDIFFTHGHLMHLPDDVIYEVCELISRKANKYILIREAFLNGRGISLRHKKKYKDYRFDRDYENMFPGFSLEEKSITDHPTKKGIRYCIYLFKKQIHE